MRVNGIVPLRPEPSAKVYDNWPLLHVSKLSVAVPTETPFVIGGALKLPPVFWKMVSAALGCPLPTLPLSVYQRWRSAPTATVSQVTRRSWTERVRGATRSGNTSISKPCPLVAGSNHEPVRPCWLRSGPVGGGGAETDADRPAKVGAILRATDPPT